MKSKTRALIAVIFVSILNFSIASAEDLYVVRCGSASTDGPGSLEELNVYVAMNGLFLVGAVDAAVDRLREEGLVEVIGGLGELDMESRILYCSGFTLKISRSSRRKQSSSFSVASTLSYES